MTLMRKVLTSMISKVISNKLVIYFDKMQLSTAINFY